VIKVISFMGCVLFLVVIALVLDASEASCKVTGVGGCYYDEGDKRLLTYQAGSENSLTWEICANLCNENGYSITGVEFGSQCFCGNKYEYTPVPAPAADCKNMDCPGDKSEYCGDGNRILILNTTCTEGCTRDEDCWLNGVCTNGKCVCDSYWEGATCQTLRLGSAQPGGAYGYSPNVTAWGGNPVLVGSTYHLFVTEITEHCGLCMWGKNSHVIHATSNNLLGPYTKKSEALPIWAHNPHIVVDYSSGSPTYLLFHIGEAQNITGSTNCHAPSPSPKKVGSAMTSGILHSATSVDGPWTPQNPQGFNGCNNPAPYIFPNSSLLLVCTDSQAYTAPNWKGPWTQRRLTYSGDGGAGTWEDPFIWRDHRGNFKMFQHVYPSGGNYWDRVSGFAYSRNGIDWVKGSFQPYTSRVQQTDGESKFYTTRERPKIFFDPKDRDTITPLAMFNGVAVGSNKLTCGVDWTFNLAQPILTN